MSEKPRRGRPITKAEPDHTVLSRIPLSLWHKVEAYAKLHKQSISELVRDGLEMRLEYDPRALQAPESTADNNGAMSAGIVRRLAEQLTDLSTILAAGANTLLESLQFASNTEYTKSVPEDRSATLLENDSVLQVLQEMSSSLSSGGENDTPSIEENIEVIQNIYNVIHKIEQSNMEEDSSITENNITVIQNKDDEDITPITADIQKTPDFDRTRYKLGQLCERGHDWHGTGQSLRRITKRDCVECGRLTKGQTHQRVSAPAVAVSALAFDPTRFVLGTLCPRGHEYEGSGQSLLRLPKHVCPQCDAERARERRKALQTLAPTPGVENE